jgi:hypothetical protein
MNTSGTGTVFTIGYWVVLAMTIMCAVQLQDGGLEGTIFNLLVLFVVATLAVYAWGGTRAIGLFLVGVLGFNLIATCAFAAPGGGNSAATIFLGTSMVGLAVVRLRAVPALAAAVVVAAAGVALIAVNDAHGIPILGGLAIGAGLALAGSGRAVPAGDVA